MKRRCFMRVLALMLAVILVSLEFRSYADTVAADTTDETTSATEEETSEDTSDEESTDEDTSEDTTEDETSEDDATTEDAEEESEDEDSEDTEESEDEDSADYDYLERINSNYTKVSSAYTYDEYDGDEVVISVTDAYQGAVDSEGNEVDALTTDTCDYEESDEVVCLGVGDTATFVITAPEDGVYVFSFDQLSYNEESILTTEMTITLNGEVPFYEANRVVYESLWVDDDTVATDRYGNQIVSVPDKALLWQKSYIGDASYRYTTPLKLELSEGENIVTLKITEGDVLIGNFYLSAEEEVSSYVTGNTTVEGDDTYYAIQAELPTYKNDSSIRATCEYDPDLYPYSSSKKVLNIIDSASFCDSGMELTYEVEVAKAGYYYIAFNYRQSDKVDFPVFMNIKINGEYQNDEMISYPFYYAKSFTKMTLEASDGNYMAVYLEEGVNTISIQLANDKLRETLETFDRIMSEISAVSLEITKVAGNTDSKYRSIDIEDYLPDIIDTLTEWRDDLQEAYDYLLSFSEEDSCGTISYLLTAIDNIDDLIENKEDIPYRRKELCTNTSSISQDIANAMSELTANNISIDAIYIYTEDSADQIPGKTNIFKKIWEAIKRFIASFSSQDYSVGNTDETHLQVWINRPRQYLEIFQQLIDESFTPATGIEVDLCIMPDASKLILANAAGEAPDVAQAIDYTQPYELAIRGALVDLTQFEDYAEVMSVFPEGLLVPATIGDSIYALPETFYFWVLFYRTDILEQLNIEVPTTIDEVQELIPKLKNLGFDFFYPTAGTTGQRSFGMTTPLFYQYGASMYNQTDENWDGTGEYYETAIDSEAALEAFETLTELFTIYDIPQEITSFYQHFRNGDIPIGISDYFMYSLLINAAPEIENSWGISIVPGIPETDEDGNIVYDENGDMVINTETAGAAQSSVIMDNGIETDIVLTDGSTMSREDAAWAYLSWLMSTETQTDFGIILQTSYGKEYIWNSANMEAFAELPWKSRDKEIILEAMANIVETPRIPGTYMLERELSNAYINVVTNGKVLRTSLDSAIKNIDRETKRKLQEFGYLDAYGNIIEEYQIPSVETVKAILAAGSTDSEE